MSEFWKIAGKGLLKNIIDAAFDVIRQKTDELTIKKTSIN